MDDAAECARLLRKAIESGTTGCLVWKDEKLEDRVQFDRDLKGLTLTAIEDLVHAHVVNAGRIKQKVETRDNWRGLNDFVYEILIPVSGLARDLYVELVLSDPVDKECPVAIIVNVHLSSY
jgi:hypothetical protein